MIYTLFFLLFCISFLLFIYSFFFFNDTATTEIYTLSLHDALPICEMQWLKSNQVQCPSAVIAFHFGKAANSRAGGDRKSTRLLQSRRDLVCRLLLEKKKKKKKKNKHVIKINNKKEIKNEHELTVVK